jgi:hypothetical protein
MVLRKNGVDEKDVHEHVSAADEVKILETDAPEETDAQ